MEALQRHQPRRRGALGPVAAICMGVAAAGAGDRRLRPALEPVGLARGVPGAGLVGLDAGNCLAPEPAARRRENRAVAQPGPVPALAGAQDLVVLRWARRGRRQLADPGQRAGPACAHDSAPHLAHQSGAGPAVEPGRA
ncbi:hypothetical protein G6F32_015474 [Rhizopus arrhizus]|nr:hypothetical protein G6F32_015474 [Rhizopus arrhizus]